MSSIDKKQNLQEQSIYNQFRIYNFTSLIRDDI